MVAGFITTNATSASSCEFESRSWGGLLDATLCDNVCQRLAPGVWFSPGIPVYTTNKPDCHDIKKMYLTHSII
jgi:hypothetical protein